MITYAKYGTAGNYIQHCMQTSKLPHTFPLRGSMAHWQGGFMASIALINHLHWCWVCIQVCRSAQYMALKKLFISKVLNQADQRQKF